MLRPPGKSLIDVNTTYNLNEIFFGFSVGTTTLLTVARMH